MPRILITGSNSFIGRNFIKYSKFRDIDEISVSLNQPEDIEFGKYDVVLHLAAIVHQSKKFSENTYYKVNRDLCLNVAECAKNAGVKQFIFLSTLKVYGGSTPPRKIWNEESECYPDDPYGKSKYEAEIGLKKLEDSNFIVSIIRTPIVYGEGVKANMYKIIKLVDSFPILPLKNVQNERNFTYVENLVGYIDRIIERRVTGVFIAKDNGALSTTELIKYISGYLGKEVFLFRLPKPIMKAAIWLYPSVFDRLFNSLEFENDQTMNILEYQPPFTTREGLERTIISYLEEKKKRNNSVIVK